MTSQRQEDQNLVHAYKPKILIAESERDIQTIYKSFLGGWDAAIVGTAEECLELFASPGNAYDMIVIDGHVNGIGAIKVLKQIKEISPSQHVVVTSTNSGGFKQKARSEGISFNDGNTIDIIQKPFSFTQLLSLLHSKVPRVSKVGLTDHVLAIYENAEEEFNEAIAFLKRSIQNNETALFIVRKDYDIKDLKAKMHACGIDADRLVSSSSLIIMHNEDWYIPDKQVDKYRIIDQWNMLVENCRNVGKKGVRAFCMMDCFFENNFAEEVVDYEHALPTKFKVPFVPICAYRKQDIDKLSEDQKRRLVVCHSHVWTSDKGLR